MNAAKAVQDAITPFRAENPSRRFYDGDLFPPEKERVWPHVWQMACRVKL